MIYEEKEVLIDKLEDLQRLVIGWNTCIYDIIRRKYLQNICPEDELMNLDLMACEIKSIITGEIDEIAISIRHDSLLEENNQN